MQSMGQQTNTISDWLAGCHRGFCRSLRGSLCMENHTGYNFLPDRLSIERMQVYDYERKQNVSVYAPEKIGGMDDYDFYLWGARALLTIQNPECHNGKKLLLFRDSFGSSIAPLFSGVL